MTNGDEIPEAPPAELSRAGAVVDKAIEYMAGQNIGEVAIASALLGGALALLAHHMSDEAILRVLNNAQESVQVGRVTRRRRVALRRCPQHPTMQNGLHFRDLEFRGHMPE